MNGAIENEIRYAIRELGTDDLMRLCEHVWRMGMNAGYDAAEREWALAHHEEVCGARSGAGLRSHRAYRR